MTVGVVIPSLVRADKLKRALNSIIEHTASSDVRLFNNWTHRGVAEVCRTFSELRVDGHSVRVEAHPENLGCAASWNKGLASLFEDGHEWAIVMNDDAELLEGCSEALKRALDDGFDLAWSDQSFACFAIHKRAVNRAGWFDENFWPAYHEDEDFMHRMRLAGLKSGLARGAHAAHTSSSTLAYSSFLGLQHKMRLDQKNLIYYGRKWGGVPNFELYGCPFNDAKNPLSYWPEPTPGKLGLRLDEHDQVVLEQDKPLSVRVYGPTFGNGSTARVARGLVEAFTELGIHAGTVNMDAIESSEIHEAAGRGSALGIYVGNPTFVSATMAGGHDMVFSILAPNSSWLPERVVSNLRDRSAIVAPSSWGVDVLVAHGCQRMPPLRHGVARGFAPASEERRAMLREEYEEGHFRVLHLSSSDRSRKGTRELFAAWRNLVRAKKLGAYPCLIAFVDAPHGTFVEAEGDVTIRLRNDRLDASEADMAGAYQMVHLVAQPSRGEGFGMVPVEARACGTPVMATDCTGHRDHMWPEPPGCVVVETGEDAPIDDGPGAMAPRLEVAAVEAALLRSFEQWRDLFEEAGRSAERVRSEWSWTAQTEKWLEQMNLWRRQP